MTLVPVFSALIDVIQALIPILFIVFSIYSAFNAKREEKNKKKIDVEAFREKMKRRAQQQENAPQTSSQARPQVPMAGTSRASMYDDRPASGRQTAGGTTSAAPAGPKSAANDSIASEIEEFLRRTNPAAAQRRTAEQPTQRRAAEVRPQPQRAQPPQQPQRRPLAPEFSSSREEPLRQPLPSRQRTPQQTPAKPQPQQSRQPTPAKKPLAQRQLDSNLAQRSLGSSGGAQQRSLGNLKPQLSATQKADQAKVAAAEINAPIGLGALLANRQNLQTAILLKEVLDRPVHRW